MSAVMDEEVTTEAPVVTVEATGSKVRPYNIGVQATVWGDVIQLVNENEAAAISRGISKELEKVYSGSFEDDEQVTINPTEKYLTPIVEAMKTLGLEVDLDSVPQPEKAASATRTKTPKEPTFCLFSGEPTGGGRFRPGYDMKMRGALIRIIEDPDLGDTDTVRVGLGNATQDYTVEQATAKLVEFGWYTEEELQTRRSKAISDANAKREAAAQREAERAAKKAAKEASQDASE